METQGLYYRSFKIDVKSIDEQNKSVDVSFSSEQPHQKYEWSPPEILLHGKDNVDLSMLKNLGSVLMNHQPSGPGQPVEIVGRPENIRIENQKGRATVFFDRDEKSELAFQKVLSGSLKGISVGATVKQVVEVENRDTFEFEGRTFEGPVILALKWAPREISFTPIAVDTNVGVNRSLSDFHEQQLSTEGHGMDDKDKIEVGTIVKTIIDAGAFIKKEDLDGFGKEIAKSIITQIAEERKVKMQFDNSVLKDLLNRAGCISDSFKASVADMATEGKTESDILRSITEEVVKGGDTHDTQGTQSGLHAKPNAEKIERKVVKSFEGLDDDDFFSGLGSPITTIS